MYPLMWANFGFNYVAVVILTVSSPCT